jgi:hypothetical protein
MHAAVDVAIKAAQKALLGKYGDALPEVCTLEMIKEKVLA